jgi:ubiquinone/menaquinone biosynthesis C-methylase UbiE
MQLKQTYEQASIHKAWDTAYRSSSMQDSFNERIMDRLMLYLEPAPGALFLDAGCGKANHTFRIVRRGYRCIGVDLSEHVIGECRQKAMELGFQDRVLFVCEGLEAISFPDNTFDGIHCRGVLMHIPNYERALSELWARKQITCAIWPRQLR